MAGDDYIPSRWESYGERIFNYLITNIPSHTIRQAWLRRIGATIGRDTSIMLGTNVLGAGRLIIGNNCSIGSKVLLDARGGLTIDDCVVIASEAQIITGKHLINTDNFSNMLRPVHIGHHAWIATRAMVLLDVVIGAGAVVGACSLVTSDVKDMEVVAGVPAKVRGTRQSALAYTPKFRPLLY